MTSKAERPQPRWLLLVHQLPARPTNVRVKTWRRLQDVGAVAVKNSVYALPNSKESREDFEWIKEEIEAMKGQASVFAADDVDATSDAELVASFRRNVEREYRRLLREAKELLRSARNVKRGRPARSRLERDSKTLRERWAAIARRDFFGAAGGETISETLDEIEKLLSERSAPSPERAVERLSRKDYRHRLWVTRPRPGIDRMGSAWLIRRFIDPDARFGFTERSRAAERAVPFDMFGVELGHHGDRCTMENLVERFGIEDRAVEAMSRIVHQADLKDGRYVSADAQAIDRLIRGLQRIYSDDQELLEQGILLFETLYRSFEHAPRSSKPARRLSKGK